MMVVAYPVKMIVHGLREDVFFELDARDQKHFVMRLVVTTGSFPISNLSVLARSVSTFDLDFNDYKGPSDESLILELQSMFKHGNNEGLEVELTDELVDTIVKYKKEMYQ